MSEVVKSSNHLHLDRLCFIPESGAFCAQMGETVCAQDAVGAGKGQGQETRWFCRGHTETQVDLRAPLPPDYNRAASVLQGAWAVLWQSLRASRA